MANLPEGLAQFEYQKMQLIGSLGAVAETMRNCAAIADQFAQMVSHVPFSPTAMQGHANGFAMAMPPATPTAAESKRKRAATDNGTEKKKRAPRDPNAPKRPASSYLLFQNEVRQELKAKNPTLPNNELLGIIAKLWSELPREQKQRYEDRQKVAKDEWLAQKSVYEAANSAAAITAASPAALIVAPAPVAPAPIVQSSEAEEESSETDSSSEVSSSDSEDEKPAKKPKKEAVTAVRAVVSPPKAELPVKEKKHKKSKA